MYACFWCATSFSSDLSCLVGFGIEWNPECKRNICARFLLAIDSICVFYRVNKAACAQAADVKPLPCRTQQCSVAEKGHCLMWFCKRNRTTLQRTAVLEPRTHANLCALRCISSKCYQFATHFELKTHRIKDAHLLAPDRARSKRVLHIYELQFIAQNK